MIWLCNVFLPLGPMRVENRVWCQNTIIIHAILYYCYYYSGAAMINMKLFAAARAHFRPTGLCGLTRATFRIPEAATFVHVSHAKTACAHLSSCQIMNIIILLLKPRREAAARRWTQLPIQDGVLTKTSLKEKVWSEEHIFSSAQELELSICFSLLYQIKGIL